MANPTPDSGATDWLALSDEQLLAGCEVHTYKSSGPGGQHRNKVSSAVRVRHRPTGISAHGDETRSQHENKRLALRRLRMNLALQLRRAVDTRTVSPKTLPPEVADCIVRPGPGEPGRMDVSPRNERFWPLARFLLDLLDACRARAADAAVLLGVTTSNYISQLRRDHHLWAAAQQLRKLHGLGPLM